MNKKGRKALALGVSLLLAAVPISCSEGEMDVSQDKTLGKNEGDTSPDLLNEQDYLSLVTKLNPKLSPEDFEDITAAIEKYSARYEVPPNLIIAVIAAESEFHPSLRGALDDTGLMQIRFKYASYWAKMMAIPAPKSKNELARIETNIHMGTFILKRLLDRYDGNIERVLVAYNAGETYVDRKIKTAQALPTRYIRRVSNFHMDLCNSPLASILAY